MEDNPSRGEEGNPVQEQAGTYYQKVDLELQVTFRHLAGAPREAQSRLCSWRFRVSVMSSKQSANSNPPTISADCLKQ